MPTRNEPERYVSDGADTYFCAESGQQGGDRSHDARRYSGTGGQSGYGSGRSNDDSGFGIPGNEERGPSNPGHQTKGPFRRTDDRIKQQVSQLLADHLESDASKITAEVTDGLVTLTGTAADREHLRMIEDLVLAMADLEGVRVSSSIELKADTDSA